MSYLNFSGGDYSTTYAVPGTHTGYGAWEYPGAYTDRIRANSFAQLVESSEITAPVRVSILVDWDAAGSGSEIGPCVLNSSQTGFSALFAGANVLIRKEVSGSGGATITAAVAHGMTAGIEYVLSAEWDNTTGAINVYVDGVLKTTGTYTDNLTGMNAGMQHYNDGAFSAKYLNVEPVSAAAASITDIDQLIGGSTSTVTFSAAFTPTGLLIFDGDSGIIVSSFTGSGAVWDFECPPLTDGVPGPRLGAVVVTATDGTDTTAEFASTYAKTGYTGVVLTSVATGHVGQGFSPALAIGNQIAYDNTKGVVGVDGVYVDEPPDAYTGEQTMWDHNVDDFKWRSFIVETIDGEVVVDNTPDPFSFTPVSNADPDTPYTSNEVIISGLGLETDLSIVGGEYSKNGGAFTSADGVINNSDTLELKITSSINPMDTVNSTVTVGTFSATFRISGPAAGGGSGGGDEFGTIYLTARGM